MEKCGYRTVPGPDANGLYLGAPPLRNQKFADSSVEGDGFELSSRSGSAPLRAGGAERGNHLARRPRGVS